MHELRPLPDSDVEMLLRSDWAPTGVELPKNDISPGVPCGDHPAYPRDLPATRASADADEASRRDQPAQRVLDRCDGDSQREPRHRSRVDLCRPFHAHVCQIIRSEVGDISRQATPPCNKQRSMSREVVVTDSLSDTAQPIGFAMYRKSPYDDLYVQHGIC